MSSNEAGSRAGWNADGDASSQPPPTARRCYLLLSTPVFIFLPNLDFLKDRFSPGNTVNKAELEQQAQFISAGS